MTAATKHAEKLKVVLGRLRGGKNVQNRQLLALLGEDEYARFLDEWRDQQELRDTLKNKPFEISVYELMLKKAMFTYSKADVASARGKQQAAKRLFSDAETQFERLAEYLSEHISGRMDLECWLDRNVHSDAANAPNSSADSFPCVITSRSLRNEGGGLLSVKRTKLQVKMDAVERALDQIGQNTVGDVGVENVVAAGRRLKGLAGN